jgi:predicted RNA-binding protein YlxR (DUF448 family)
MSQAIQFRCLGCGRCQQGPAGGPCKWCGAALCALGKLDLPGSARKLPPPGRGECPAPGWRPQNCVPRRTLALIVLLGLAGMLGICGEVGFLEAGRRADQEELANNRVAAKVKAAGELLAARRWDQAAALLKDAVATPDATEVARAENLLAQVRPAQVADLLATAQDAVQKKDPARAANLLRAYLAAPEALHKSQAARLLSDLELATSAVKADDVLRKLPDESLTVFADHGSLPALDRFRDSALQAIYVTTLRARLGPELNRRAAVRQEQERRVARMRATAAYKELLRFVGAARQSQTRFRTDPQRVAYLFQELNIIDPAEQNRALAELTGPPTEAAALRQSIARERLALKERFRTYPGFDQTDRERFEQMVDQELDRLERDLGAPTAS